MVVTAYSLRNNIPNIKALNTKRSSISQGMVLPNKGKKVLNFEEKFNRVVHLFYKKRLWLFSYKHTFFIY